MVICGQKGRLTLLDSAGDERYCASPIGAGLNGFSDYQPLSQHLDAFRGTEIKRTLTALVCVNLLSTRRQRCRVSTIQALSLDPRASHRCKWVTGH